MRFSICASNQDQQLQLASDRIYRWLENHEKSTGHSSSAQNNHCNCMQRCTCVRQMHGPISSTLDCRPGCMGRVDFRVPLSHP
jgi:hypothetical protein